MRSPAAPAPSDLLIEDEPGEACTEEPGLALEEFLPEIPVSTQAQAPLAQAPLPVSPSLRTARVIAMDDRRCKIAWRGSSTPIDAELAPELACELVATALAQHDSVLVESLPGETPVVVGVLQTRLPREIRLKAATVHIEGEREVLLRSGTAAIRIREDGDIEVVGSRISAASRGLFRLVGRMLRLN